MGEATHVIWSKECGASIYLLTFAVRLNSSKNIVLKIAINKIEQNGLSLRLQIAHKNNVIIFMKIMIMKTIIIVFRSSRILDEKLGLVSVLAFFFLHSREVGGEERKKRKRKKNKNLSTVVSSLQICVVWIAEPENWAA